MNQLKKNIKKQLLVMFFTLFLIAGVAYNPMAANGEEVTSISLDAAQTSARYAVGTTINLSEIYVLVNGLLPAVPADTLPGAEIDQPENTQIGWKDVTLTYAGLTTTYRIKVVPKPPTVYSTRILDFDTIRTYTQYDGDVTGANFSYRDAATDKWISMGLTKSITTSTTTGAELLYDTVILLKPGKTYAFRVRTYKDVNGERFYSDWSGEKSRALPALTGYQRWRWEAKRQLVAHGVYTKYRLDVLMNIIEHESGGSERAGAGRTCVGLLQFTSGWKHNYTQSYFTQHGITNFQTDNRLSGSWSLHRFAHVLRDGGMTAVKKHWSSTWNK